MMRNWGFKNSYSATSEWFNFDGNKYLLILIGLHWFMGSWKILLFFRQYLAAKKAEIPPPELVKRLSTTDYKKMRITSMAKSISSITAIFILLTIKSLKLVLNYHPFLWELTEYYGETPLKRAVWYAALDVLFLKLMLLPLAIFGMLLSLYSGVQVVIAVVVIIVVATLLEIVSAAMLAAVFMLVLAVLTDYYGPILLYYTPIISNFIGLVGMAYYIEFIAPNKLTKVIDAHQQLKKQLEPLAGSVGFPLDHIYVDGNRISGPNAYYTGVFGANMIALTPSLIKIMSEQQVTATVAHEIGHWYHHHNSIGLLFSIFMVLFSGYSLFLSHGSSLIIETFRFRERPHGMIPVYLCITYCSPLLVDLIDGIHSIIGCYCEYVADNFAVVHHLGTALKTALLTLAAKSGAFPVNDALYAAWFLHHPTIINRVRRIND